MKEKLDESLSNIPIVILSGNDANKFQEYNNRKLTKKELDSLKEADKFYNMMYERKESK